MSSEECPQSSQVSNRFDLPTSNITLQSSDKVLFRIHRVNLEMHSQVFADAASSTVGTVDNEVVALSESSAVLEVMLQYMYLQRQPDLRRLEFEIMKDLAEAVEKYQIYSAMGVCSQRMRECIPEHPIDVLLYAVRHKYPDIANESAEATLGMSPYSMLSRLPQGLFAAWTEYSEVYRDLLAKEFSRFGPTRLHKGVTTPCDVWHEQYAVIASELSSGIGASNGKVWLRTGSFPGFYPHSQAGSRDRDRGLHVLARLPILIERRQALCGDRCGDCKRELGYWIHQSERDCRELRRFSEYL
ncbi:hypothetical protein Moror_5316 [Moniliophthora roreri MCA 2997]|uniref:BTB domain-containing protein n=2 Tax=Moniliophthora roreri TaxID=221103 RepID=V2WQF5_MONRO|nr:hypothetical protein Moror_5316 [Moniliophthora roreri MCA 2997]KAI3595091.1 hypothetical protein WG66_001102 [Moniliophthora roreri]